METVVIVTMIVCATIVALIAIIFNYLVERKITKENAQCALSKKIIKIHRNYITSFLGFAIIMLLTSKFGGPKNAIFEYLSFGSTITSLVLSILAIFVTVQSSSDLYKQFARIDDASRTIEKSSKNIENTLGKLDEAKDTLQKTSETIENQFNDVSVKIIEYIKNYQEEIASKLKEFENILNNPENKKEHSSKPDGDSLINFIDITSPSGSLAIYACSLSNEKKRPFELSKLFEDNKDYIFGFLIASASMGYISMEVKDNNITCNACPLEAEKIKERIQDKLKAFDDSLRERVDHIISKIESNFKE
jgi:formiminotetrahydrofolate cyclodeaminase